MLYWGKKKTRFAKLSFDGSESSVIYATRQFTADSALKKINQETVKLLMNEGNKNAFPGVRYVSFEAKQIGGRTIKQDELINGWILHDLAYRIILHSSDYRGKAIEDESELAALVSVASLFNQRKEKAWLEEIDNSTDKEQLLKLYLWGFAGEQFKYETIRKCLDNAGRELYILFECCSRIDTDIDVAAIVDQETGMQWKEVVSYVFFAWFQSTQNDEVIYQLKDGIEWSDPFSFEKYSSIINRYALSYDDVRKNQLDLGRQMFYTKPFVITQKNEIISINTYLNLFLYEHCILWIVRDHFFKKKDQKFTSVFGKLFERYFQDILEQYLDSSRFYKIKEQQHKRADWYIQLMGHKFLVEQKSAFLGLLAKQQESNIEVFREYCVKNIIKALGQLAQTEIDYDDGKYIKIVLLYEEYINPDALDDIFALSECNTTDDRYYWVMTISEMEMMLRYYSEDPDGFNALVNEKIQLEETKSNDGRSIEKLLSKRGIVENKHVSEGNLVFYRELAQEMTKHIIGRE